MTRELTPREIVAELDRHIVGQARAKRAVAVAMRGRWRMRRLDPDLAREVAPKNIVMVGPTGVGKTEIARRLSTLVGAPFLKVEASKFTEVGYHGRDVESIVRDLLEIAIRMVRAEHAETVRARAEEAVERRLVGLLLGLEPRAEEPRSAETPADPDEADRHARARERLAEKLRAGDLDDRELEISVRERPASPLVGAMSPDQLDPGMASMLESLMPERRKRRRVTVRRARTLLLEEEIDALVDDERITETAIERTERSGIVFLDEIDKIASGGEGRSADVSRQGVQRDLLPIVEGTTVTTRHGPVRTDQVLFIAAGAFHVAAVTDLMPELQGRFPIRVELEALTRDDFRRILVEPDAAIVRQQEALLATEGVTLEFAESAIDAMADLAAEANARLENIGARRLVTVIEQVLEEISFEAPDRAPATIPIDGDFVRGRVEPLLRDEDLSRFVL